MTCGSEQFSSGFVFTNKTYVNQSVDSPVFPGWHFCLFPKSGDIGPLRTLPISINKSHPRYRLIVIFSPHLQLVLRFLCQVLFSHPICKALKHKIWRCWSREHGVWWSFQLPDLGLSRDTYKADVCLLSGHQHWLVGGLEGTFFVFPNSWDDDPIWLIFFRGVETTNKGYCPMLVSIQV